MNNTYIEIDEYLTHRTTSQCNTAYRNNATALKPRYKIHMKSKFGSFDFGSVEVLSREEQSKVKGGYQGGGAGGQMGVVCCVTCYTTTSGSYDKCCQSASDCTPSCSLGNGWQSPKTCKTYKI
jgi:hypothetical protein